jgi:hypothetical protein
LAIYRIEISRNRWGIKMMGVKYGRKIDVKIRGIERHGKGDAKEIW